VYKLTKTRISVFLFYVDLVTKELSLLQNVDRFEFYVDRLEGFLGW
jgi:hypothetical protein